MTSKPNAIVYLRRNDLIVGGKHITPGKLKFTSDLIENLEIQDPDKFVSTCADFFASHDMKGKKVLIVLDQSVVFDKNLNLDEMSKAEADDISDGFISAMPFSAGQRVSVKYHKDNNIFLYATNSDLFQAINEALDVSGIRKLVSVTPAIAYKIDYSGKSSDIIDQFLTDKKIRNKINFSTVNPI